MQEQLSVVESLEKLSNSLQNSIVECGMEWGMSISEGRAEECNKIQRVMCGIASYRDHFSRIGQEMLAFQADPLKAHTSIQMAFNTEAFRPEEPVLMQQGVTLMTRPKESNTLLTAKELGRTEVIQELLAPKRRGRRAISKTEEELGPKNARMHTKIGEHTSKPGARRGLVEGTYTQAKEYEPWLLRAMLELGDGVGFSRIQHEMRDIMTGLGVIKKLDLEMTGTHTPRYQAQTSSLRNSMERRGLIFRNSSNKWELTPAGKNAAREHQADHAEHLDAIHHKDNFHEDNIHEDNIHEVALFG